MHSTKKNDQHAPKPLIVRFEAALDGVLARYHGQLTSSAPRLPALSLCREGWEMVREDQVESSMDHEYSYRDSGGSGTDTKDLLTHCRSSPDG